MAIPETIKKLANDVRTKVYGREVREALASGIEAAGETAEDARIKSEDTEIRQTVLEKQFDDEIANMTLADPSSAEIVAARTNANTGESYDTIGRRLDAEHANVTAQLAQKAVNVVNLDYYAHADGVTIDDENIKQALDDLNGMGGGILYAPSTYLIENSIMIPYDNITIKGDGKKSKFKLLSNGKLCFQKVWEEVIPKTNPKAEDYNNLPPYKNIDYFNPIEFGGSNNRVSNVAITDITFEKTDGSSGSQHALHFFKCDGVTVKNVDFTFINPQPQQGSTQDNALTMYYCSDIEVKNTTIHDNYRMNFGLFIYWSYGIKLTNIKTGNVGVRGLEMKHIVNAEIDTLTCHVKDKVNTVRGISVHYGSQNVRLKNIHLINCDIALMSAVEFEYNQNIHVDGLTIVGRGLVLSNLKDFTINNVKINLTNTRSTIYAIQILMQPLYHDAVDSLNGVMKNSSHFTYDGDYDYYQSLTHGGVTHYRLMTYLANPTLLSGTITNVEVTVEKVSNGLTNTEFHSFYFYGDSGITGLTLDGRYKLINGNYPISLKHVIIDGYTVNFVGDNDASKKIGHIFLHGGNLSLVDCEIKNVKENVSGVVGTGNVPEIYNFSLLSLAKLDKVKLENIRVMPYATYGQYFIIIKGFNDVRLKDIHVKITNLTGSYNPTTIKLIEVTSDVSNEDYHRITFEDIQSKGFNCYLYFKRDSATFANNQFQLARAINNDVENTSVTKDTFAFVRDNLNRILDVQEMLNTVNGEPK